MSNPLADGVRHGPPDEVPQVALRAADFPPPRLLVIPDDDVADADDPGSAPRPAAPRQPRDARRAVRSAVYILVGAVAGAGAFQAATRILPSRSASAPVAHAAAVEVPAPASLSALSDTLALAVTSFELRTRLFGAHQMQCPDLARGLILLEQRWTAYNGARRDAGVTLDSIQEATDRSLYARVDQAEGQFERSACPRP